MDEINNFLNSIKDLSNLAQTETFITNCSEYILTYVDSKNSREWYLVGENEIEGRNFASGHTIKSTSSELIISIINLAMEIYKKKGFNNDVNINGEPICVDEIKEWCKKYGIPYKDTNFSNQYRKNNRIPYNVDVFGFSINAFKVKLFELYKVFLTWHGFEFDDIANALRNSVFILNKLGYEDKDIPSFFSMYSNIDEVISSIKGLLSYMMHRGMKSEIKLQYDRHNNRFFIVPHTDNLISVAYFQLAMLMTNNGIGSLKFCSMCHTLFEIKHGSTKTCNSCKREYHRIKEQESRERKRRNASAKEKDDKLEV